MTPEMIADERRILMARKVEIETMLSPNAESPVDRDTSVDLLLEYKRIIQALERLL